MLAKQSLIKFRLDVMNRGRLSVSGVMNLAYVLFRAMNCACRGMINNIFNGQMRNLTFRLSHYNDIPSL